MLGFPAYRPAPVEAAAQKPNIIVILTDDMRADDLRFMPKTRKYFKSNGLKFTNAVSPHPLCCPARAELITGQYGQNNGVHYNSGANGGRAALINENNNIGSWLQDAGYRTGYFGKYLNGYDKTSSRPKGWNVWDPIVARLYSYTNAVWFGNETHPNEYVVDTTSRKVRRFIDKSSGPFFAFVNHTAPHGAAGKPLGNRYPIYKSRFKNEFKDVTVPNFPVNTEIPARMRDEGERSPGSNVNRFMRARGRALISVDNHVASIVRQLRKSGELDNTIIVFTSDNGFLVGEHGLFGKNLLLEKSLKIPLLISGPGIGRGVDRHLVTLVDLVAAIVKWTHSNPGRTLDGLPFDESRGRDAVLIQTGRPSGTNGWSYRGIMTNRYLYAVDMDGKKGLLFDGDESKNLWNSDRYQDTKSLLDSIYQDLKNCKGIECNLQ